MNNVLNNISLYEDIVQTRHDIANKDYIRDLMKEVQIEKDIEYFPVLRALDHTMGYSIDKYVIQRLPSKLFENAVYNGIPINVHGIYPAHVSLLEEKLPNTKLQEFVFLPNKRQKQFNHVRPRYFVQGELEALHILVTPGSDYVYHYASMIRHLLSTLSIDSKSLLSIYRYPKLEQNIAIWTGLNEEFIRPNDVLVLGYVNEVLGYIKNKMPIEQISRCENNYYSSIRYQIGEKVVNFLGVKYSFWGNISKKIALQGCKCNMQELVYIAKQGSLTRPEHLYDKVYSATCYLNMNANKVVDIVDDLHNSFTRLFPQLDSGCHLSVPTVLEEDYAQRKIAVDLYNATSIDNEISQIANGISYYNKKFGSNVKYFNMHFATDYVRGPKEKLLETCFDLANNRTEKAISRKNIVLNKISDYFIQYLKQT